MTDNILATVTGPQLIALAIGCGLAAIGCWGLGNLISKLKSSLTGE